MSDTGTTLLTVRNISKSSLATFRQRFDDALFRDEWIDHVYQHRLRYYGIYHSTQMVGGFVMYEGGKGPLRTLITPPFYPHIGLFVTDLQIDNASIIQSLLNFARSPYVCYVKMDLPLRFHTETPHAYWKERWTYRLSLKEGEINLLESFHPSIKSNYQKALKERITFRAMDNKLASLEMIKTNLDHKQVRYKNQILENIHQYFIDHPQVYYWGSFQEDRLIATNIILIDNGVAYHLFSAFDRKANLNYANAAHLTATLLELQTLHPEVHTFDFEGSTVPSVDFYFKRFRGQQHKYLSLFYSKLPALFKSL
jgi:hypothetical protein